MYELRNLLDKNKIKDVKEILEKLIKLYKSNSKIVDHIYCEKSTIRNSKRNQSTFIDNELSKNKDNKIIKLIK